MKMKSGQAFHVKRKPFAPITITGALLIVLLAVGSFLPACPTAYAGNPSVWSLVWRDEFDGPAGSVVDSSKWSFDVGGNGWGNNELESYTSRTANAHLEGGLLVIKALKETFTGPDGVTRDYTSARLLTKNKFSQAYGRFEARIKIPYSQGLWPAFWLLGDNIDTAHWPNCGEIDIMENIGKEPSIVHGTFHGPGYSGGSGVSWAYSLPSGQKFSDDFHTFAVEWEPNVIRFYVDGLLYKTRTPADLPAGTSWVFDHPFFIILNVAVGGGWPGNPDATTVFPQQMLVDYVRVYQRAYNFSSDYTTRVMLLSANLDLEPGDGPSIVTAQADDGKGRTYLLAVEWIGRLPSFDWITVVIAKLPDELLSANQALIRVTQTINPAIRFRFPFRPDVSGDRILQTGGLS